VSVALGPSSLLPLKTARSGSVSTAAQQSTAKPTVQTTKQSIQQNQSAPTGPIVSAADSKQMVKDALRAAGSRVVPALKDLKNVPTFKQDAPFPTEVIPQTDESRLERFPKCLSELTGLEIYISKKMDGQSVTAFLDAQGRFTLCSRNKVCDVGSTFYQYAKKVGLETKLRGLGYPVAIQFEWCGPGSNGNKMGLLTHDMWVFTVKKLTPNNNNNNNTNTNTNEEEGEQSEEDHEALSGVYCGLDELSAVCIQMEVKMVPLLERMNYDPAWNIQMFQQYANNQVGFVFYVCR
jgi:hypothetical protein